MATLYEQKRESIERIGQLMDAWLTARPDQAHQLAVQLAMRLARKMTRADREGWRAQLEASDD